MILASVTTTTEVAACPSNFTVAPATKLLPVSVTAVPPANEPLLGEIVATTGSVAALELPAAYIGPTQNGVVGTAATDPVGYLDRAVAGPGQTVTVRADLACQPAEPGFALPSDPNPNQVTLVFHAPSVC